MRETPLTATVTVIEHESACPLDRFESNLADVHIRVVRPYAGDRIPADVGDGLIVLGGRMNAYDDDHAAWLPGVRELLARCASTSVPTLGICLGAQLLAVACGGEVDVAAAPGREAGVIDVRWRDGARDDLLMSGLPDPFPGPSMHADAVSTLPAGAVWLASSSMYPYQAFRIGPSAWGVQFHPEASLPTFRGWAESSSDVDTAAVVGEFGRRAEEVNVAGAALARRFASLLDTTRSDGVPASGT